MSTVRHAGRLQRAGRHLLTAPLPGPTDFPQPTTRMPTQIPVDDILLQLELPSLLPRDDCLPTPALTASLPHPQAPSYHTPSEYWGTVGHIHFFTEEVASVQNSDRVPPGVIIDYLVMCRVGENPACWVTPAYWLSNTLCVISQEYSVAGVSSRLGLGNLADLGNVLKSHDRVLMPLLHDGH